MNNITIIPGSYKPPHKGHLSLIEKLIKKKYNKKIIVIISKKQRPLEQLFKMENVKKEDLQNLLIKYFPKEKESLLLLSKTATEKKIKDLINENKIKSINSEQSLKIWNIYLKYLKEKYKNKNIKFPIIEFKISETNNIIQETTKVMFKLFRENKPNKIILMKSEKNKDNKRFNFLTTRFGKYIETVLFPNIKDIDATDMRKYILNKNMVKFMKYLPKDLSIKDKLKIWNICIYEK
jgi:phosphopantetheine adenylyltransferase